MKSAAFLASLLLACSCSSPRYVYFFNQPTVAAPERRTVAVAETTPRPGTGILTASSGTPVTESTVNKKSARIIQETIAKAPIPNTQTHVSTPEQKHLDSDLKLSVIFVASGLVALLIGGEVLWVLGSLALGIGLIFGIKWLLRQ